MGITVEGPSESKMSCKDNKDGSCSVEYIPFSPGLYDINITYGGEHIPGETQQETPHFMSLKIKEFAIKKKKRRATFVFFLLEDAVSLA